MFVKVFLLVLAFDSTTAATNAPIYCGNSTKQIALVTITGRSRNGAKIDFCTKGSTNIHCSSCTQPGSTLAPTVYHDSVTVGIGSDVGFLLFAEEWVNPPVRTEGLYPDPKTGWPSNYTLPRFPGLNPGIRSISWWYDVGESSTTDVANIEAIRTHRKVFSRVMPYNSKIKLDGNISLWWDHDKDVAEWNAPLQEMGVPTLPYLIDTSNSTQMHLVYANATAVVQDAVAIAKHYNFQGWFIDYEDETPRDTSPNKTAHLAKFLTQLGNALHQENMSLTICVASWSSLLADYETIASSTGVDELMLMSTYSNPADSQSLIQSYFDKVRKGTPITKPTSDGLKKAGVGIGIYYDGRNGYERSWNETSARNFIQNDIVNQGGNNIDVYRLLKDGKDDWPHEEFWWDLFEDFMDGKLTATPPARIPTIDTTAPSTQLMACPVSQMTQGVRLTGHIVGFAKVCPSIETCCNLMNSGRIEGATSFTYNANASHTPIDPDCRFFGLLSSKKKWTNCTSCVSFAANVTV